VLDTSAVVRDAHRHRALTHYRPPRLPGALLGQADPL
jgi:hypothetical protein